MQDQFTSERIDKTYRALFLENEYLWLMCLPEIGGRIQAVVDKRRMEDMFYFNRVIRPGHIALRGAWVSGGIEWNRGPRGHTVTSFSPVDVVGVENPDGSASLVIGNTEMNFRTGWEVRLTLHPGRTYLDEEISLFNPTDEAHPYYFWNNTAFPNRPGTRFVFPMTLGTDHDGATFFSWPFHEGKDLTRLRNYEEPTSIFAYRSVFDFFGAYDVERDYGIVQVGNHHLLPGKKAWTWGQAESGLVSQSVLTDTDGPYIEVQSGPLPTQSDFGRLAPGQEIRWREYWYPVFGLGEGFEYATKDVAVERKGAELRLHATGVFEGAYLEMGDAVVDGMRLDPETTERIMLPDTGPIELVLRDDDGRELFSYRSPLEIPVERPPASTPDESHQTSGDGLEWYRSAVEALRSGKLQAAVRHGYVATKRPGSRALGFGIVGRALMKMGRHAQALEAFRSGYAPGGEDHQRLLDYMLIASLAAGEPEQAVEGARRAIEGGTVRLVPRAILALAGERTLEGFVREARHFVGEDEFAFIELALTFAELGRLQEAVLLLDAGKPEGRPLPLYYIAYWTSLLGEHRVSRRNLDAASRLSPDYVFPSRAEALPALELAASESDDWKPHLYLGNLLASLGRIEEAVPHWEESEGSSVACRNLAMVAWKQSGSLVEAASWLEKAIHARPSDQTLYRDLARVRMEQERAEEAVALLEEMPYEQWRRPDVTLLLVRAYVDIKRYDEAVSLLGATRFSNREGDSGTWDVFSKAHVERGIERMEENRFAEALADFEKASTYPRNLNVGRPAKPREARALYWRWKALGALGRDAEARRVLGECTRNAPSTDEQVEFIERCKEELQ